MEQLSRGRSKISNRQSAIVNRRVVGRRCGGKRKKEPQRRGGRRGTRSGDDGGEEEVFRCCGCLRRGVSVERERSGGFARVLRCGLTIEDC
jgi:hypothetical protein